MAASRDGKGELNGGVEERTGVGSTDVGRTLNERVKKQAVGSSSSLGSGVDSRGGSRLKRTAVDERGGQ